MYSEALKQYGSFRKAAKSLNLTKSKFMVLYKKELGLCTATTGCQCKSVEGKTRCEKHLRYAIETRDPLKSKKVYKDWRKNNNDYYNEYKREYYKENKESVRASSKKWEKTPTGNASRKLSRQRRRSLEKSDVQLTAQQVIDIFNKFGNKCFKCGSSDRLQLDHHIPLTKGGKLDESNTVLLCISCNSGKCDKMPEEFYSKEELEKLTKIL